MISVRVSPEEEQRVKGLAAKLIGKNRYLTEADILRELLSVVDTGLITTEMRQELSGTKKELPAPEEPDQPFTAPGFAPPSPDDPPFDNNRPGKHAVRIIGRAEIPYDELQRRRVEQPAETTDERQGKKEK